MGNLSKLVSVVARSDHNERHVSLVSILQAFLLNLYSAPNNDIVSIRSVPLVENFHPFLANMLVLGDLQKPVLHHFGILHEKPQVFAQIQVT